MKCIYLLYTISSMQKLLFQSAKVIEKPIFVTLTVIFKKKESSKQIKWSVFFVHYRCTVFS